MRKEEYYNRAEKIPQLKIFCFKFSEFKKVICEKYQSLYLFIKSEGKNKTFSCVAQILMIW